MELKILILILGIILIVLLLIDAFRRSKRKSLLKSINEKEESYKSHILELKKQKEQEFLEKEINDEDSKDYKEKTAQENIKEETKNDLKSPIDNKDNGVSININKDIEILKNIYDNDKALSNGLILLNLKAPDGYTFSGNELVGLFESLEFTYNNKNLNYDINYNGKKLAIISPMESDLNFSKESIDGLETECIQAILDTEVLNNNYKEQIEFFISEVYSLSENLEVDLLNEHNKNLTQEDFEKYLIYSENHL